ncbi:hypothetical protein Hanom_Chr10g00932531 [Helianthus anomalus]
MEALPENPTRLGDTRNTESITAKLLEDTTPEPAEVVTSELVVPFVSDNHFCSSSWFPINYSCIITRKRNAIKG